MQDTQRKIDFILELEKLKSVLRKTKPLGQERYENSAEHSWQTALTAMVLLDEAAPDLDHLKVLKMLLIHDVVEIDCGDVFVYDQAARAAVQEQEEKAAKRIFGLLPAAMGDELLQLWQEFESRATPEAQFAKAVDRVNPVLQNLNAGGQSWVENDISRQQVLDMNREIQNASPQLWAAVESMIMESAFFANEG